MELEKKLNKLFGLEVTTESNLEFLIFLSPIKKILLIENFLFKAILKNEFSKCFSKSNLVIICPLYAAGEKKNFKFNLIKFANLIVKNSKTQVIIVKNEIELSKYFKKNLLWKYRL